MKSKLLYLMLLVALVPFMSSCDEDTKGVTFTTYYPVLTLEGETTLYVDKGSTFTDPGYYAELNGEDVTSQVIVTSNVNTSTSGVYTITYSITNEDGFNSSTSRSVIVTDPNDPIEGFYDTDPEESYRDYNGITPYGDSYEVLILNNGDGTYTVDDMFGGWYAVRAGYGTSYAMEGIIAIDDDGTVELLDSYVPGWGDSVESMTDATYDESTGTFSWLVEYTDTPIYFHVTMYKR